MLFRKSFKYKESFDKLLYIVNRIVFERVEVMFLKIKALLWSKIWKLVIRKFEKEHGEIKVETEEKQ